MIQDIVVSALINGGVYAVLAVGFSLIFGVARIVNLAHTAFYMLSAYFIFTFFSMLEWPAWAAIALAVAITTGLGLLAYRFVIEPIREHEATVLIVTIALAFIVQEGLLIAFGGHFRGNPALIEGWVEIAGARVLHQQWLAVATVFVVLGAAWGLVMKTRVGIAIRATAQDREIANLMGMNVRRVALVTIGVSVGLAAVGGAVVAPLFVVEPRMWLSPLITVLAIVVLGGLGSLKGSVLGAFIIGTVETLTVFLIPDGAFLKGAVALTIMLIVLLIRPEGLFGVAFEEER